jgi:hypothetical protein
MCQPALHAHPDLTLNHYDSFGFIPFGGPELSPVDILIAVESVVLVSLPCCTMAYLAQQFDMGGTVTANVTVTVCFIGVFVTVTLGEKRGCVPAEAKVFCW